MFSFHIAGCVVGEEGWMWGIVWYSVSLVHLGRYHFKKSKTIYQYPLNLISSFKPSSCSENLKDNPWFMAQTQSPRSAICKLVLQVCSECWKFFFFVFFLFACLLLKRVDKYAVNQQAGIISYQLGPGLAACPVCKKALPIKISNVNNPHSRRRKSKKVQYQRQQCCSEKEAGSGTFSLFLKKIFYFLTPRYPKSSNTWLWKDTRCSSLKLPHFHCSNFHLNNRERDAALFWQCRHFSVCVCVCVCWYGC